jgi:glycosyltransferase involved in cell wall biosynthesis
LKILFVAFAESIHTARWINQLQGLGWDIRLFPSMDIGFQSPDLSNVTIYHSIYGKQANLDKTIKLRGTRIFFPRTSNEIAYVCRAAIKYYRPRNRVDQLSKVIKQFQPDIIHAMEFQHAGYLVSEVKKNYRGNFPTWIATNWGSDIYLFGRLAEHQKKIKEVLETCDYYSCECQRDVQLAKQMGLKGDVLPVMPNTGGFDLERTAVLRQPGSTSARRVIMLKGYQTFAGRALVGLRALALCASELTGYHVVIYSASDDVKIAAELTSKLTGVPIEFMPPCSRDDMLRMFGQARIHIGLSISDAISTSLLESMVMGAFPIQSCTSCAEEWITEGETGSIVPPEDPEAVSAAIRKALSDDGLVDRAAGLNAKVARERLDQQLIRPKVIDMYNNIFVESKKTK